MQPDYKPADQVEPMDRVFAVFKVLSIEEVQSPKGLLSLVKVADRSGTLNLVLRESAHVEICK